jgi:hypothetical protein
MEPLSPQRPPPASVSGVASVFLVPSLDKLSLHWSTVVVVVTISVSITIAVSMTMMTAPCPLVTPPSGEYAVGASPGCADVVVRSVVMVVDACAVVGCCGTGSGEVASEDGVNDVVDVACGSDRVALVVASLLLETSATATELPTPCELA